MATARRPSFGELLRRFRQAAGLTLDELAERAGLSAKGIGALERGERRAPRKDTVALLAAALNLGEQDRARLIAAVRKDSEPPPAPPPDEPTRQRLPAHLTPLIGREREEAAIAHLLRLKAVRLLTLTGPAGIGKTRLALQVAAGIGDAFGEGALFIPLAAVREPDLVLSTIARALGVREGGQTARPDALTEALTEALRDRSLLLVLDNFEQVVDAGSVLAAVLSACPQVKALITSRATLHVRGEQEFAVPPLEVPDLAHLPALDDLARYASVALFVQRAQAVQPSFALTSELAPTVAAICARLDGLPLAIELAAARIKLLAPPVLLARLEHRLTILTGGSRDLPERQQTMRRAIAWSYELLSDVEQRLFHRLCVFAGGCMLEAAEAVCDLDGLVSVTTTNSAGTAGGASMLDALESLVDKSLLICETGEADDARFLLLELVREYGLEQLVASGEETALRRRHAEYCLALGEQAEPRLRGPEQARWLALLEREHDNLRAALGWSLECGAVELGLRLAGALWWFWYVRGHLTEGRGWLETLLAAGASDTAAVDPAVRAKALYGAGMIITEQGDYAQAAALVRESESLFRSAGDDRGLAMALNIGGNIAKYQGDLAQATMLYQECLALRRALGDRSGTAVTLNNLGTVAIERGESERARDLFNESLAIKRELGDNRGIAVALLNLGDVARDLADPDQAIHLLEESLALFRALEDTRGVALALTNLGEAARDQGDYERALETSNESLALFERLGDKWGTALALNNLGDIARDQGDISRAIEMYRRSLGFYRSESNKVGIAECLEALAGVARMLGQPERAATLWGRAATLRDAANSELPAVDRAMREREIAALGEALGEEALTAAWVAGRTLSLDEAADYAAPEGGVQPPSES